MAKGIDVKGKRIPIELDRTRYLIYDLNALAELEDRVGELDTFFKSISEKKSLPLKTMRLLLWAGLISEDEEITEKIAGALVLPDNLEYVTGKIIEAINSSMPESQEKKPVSKVQNEPQSEESTG